MTCMTQNVIFNIWKTRKICTICKIYLLSVDVDDGVFVIEMHESKRHI